MFVVGTSREKTTVVDVSAYTQPVSVFQCLLAVTKFMSVRWTLLHSKIHSAWSESWGCLSPTTPISKGPKVPNFDGNPPFVCFRTKSDVHPVNTKSLSENHFTIFEIFGKTYLILFAPIVKFQKNRNLESGVVLLCWILLRMGLGERMEPGERKTKSISRIENARPNHLHAYVHFSSPVIWSVIFWSCIRQQRS